MHEILGQDKKAQSAAFAALALLSLFLFAKTITEFKGYRYIGNDKPAQSVIEVTGKGEAVAIPDIATFTFGVSEESLVVGEAQEKATKTSNALLDFLAKNGVDKKDVQTTGYNIYPRYDYTNYTYGHSGKQTLAAYVVSQNFSVKVRKINEAGRLLSGIGEYGATDVSGLSFSLDKQDDIVKQAREKAIAEARENAKVLAQDLGVSLVRIISFSENGQFPIYYAKAMSADSFGGRGGAAPVPELPAGETKIVSNVSITYEIR